MVYVSQYTLQHILTQSLTTHCLTWIFQHHTHTHKGLQARTHVYWLQYRKTLQQIQHEFFLRKSFLPLHLPNDSAIGIYRERRKSRCQQKKDCSNQVVSERMDGLPKTCKSTNVKQLQLQVHVDQKYVWWTLCNQPILQAEKDSDRMQNE